MTNDTSEATDPTPELQKLLELTTRFPEVGPPLTALCYKIGQPQFAQRFIKLGTTEQPGLEYFIVTAHAARRENRAKDAVESCINGLIAFAKSTQRDPEDGQRLLQLLRIGFAVLLFDAKDKSALQNYAIELNKTLPQLSATMGTDPSYRVLVAQSLWATDREQSEKEWDSAVLDAQPTDKDTVWNARGTWYKEAEFDLDKAERAYRSGLDTAPKSALLMHNLAQVLLDQAERTDSSDNTRRLLRASEELLRNSLREETPKGLRRHIHLTLDRLNTFRASLPPPPPRQHQNYGPNIPREREREIPREMPREIPQDTAPAPELREPPVEEPLPKVGDVIKGKVKNLVPYGAFVAITETGRLQGLLHVSELDHQPVHDATTVLKIGDEIEVKVLEVVPKDRTNRARIALSRKALIPQQPQPPQSKSKLAMLIEEKLRRDAAR